MINAAKKLVKLLTTEMISVSVKVSVVTGL